MNYKSYLKTVRILKQKLLLAYRTYSRKHIKLISRELTTFVLKYQHIAMADYSAQNEYEN